MPRNLDLDLRRVDAARFANLRPTTVDLRASLMAGVADELARAGVAERSALRSAGPESVVNTFALSRSLPAQMGTELFVALALEVRAAGGDVQPLAAAARAMGADAFGEELPWPTLAEPMNDSLAVELVQLLLNRSAAAGLDVDGDFGDHTGDAVAAFQAHSGLKADRVVGDDTWRELVKALPTFTEGQTDPAIGIAQRRLSELGYGPLSGTGTFGPKTKEALGSFQTEHALPNQAAIDLPVWRELLGTALAHTGSAAIEAEKVSLRNAVETGMGAVASASRDRVRAVTTEAISWLGIREQPEGSNRGPEVDQLVGTAGVYWCALAVSNWLKRGLAVSAWSQVPFGRELALCNDIRAWGVQGGRFLTVGATVPPGAIFVQNKDGTHTTPEVAFAKGHTGFVLEDLGDRVRTIEGNASNSVKSNVRGKGDADMVGFLTWW